MAVNSSRNVSAARAFDRYPFGNQAMSLFGPASTHQLSLGIALVRVIVGIIFVAHGYAKFFVFGIDGATGMFAQMGIPAPSITAPLVATLEVAGGIALILGFLTRLAALGLAIDMLGAIFLVRIKGGFFAPNGAEFEILLCIACIALAIAGPGAVSVDEAIAWRRMVAAGDPDAPTR
jgi:putative oxidoreductase